jgi:general secretion pathway protein K
MRREAEHGFALIVVLLVVAVVSVIAVSVLDDIRFSIRGQRNARALTQGGWYAVAAETVAKARLRRVAGGPGGVTTLAGGWNDRWLNQPVEDGLLRVRVGDATDCFNVNSLVEADAGEPFRRRDVAVQQFVTLLEQLRIGDAQRLADNLADWMDFNDVSAGGAEDETYLRAPVPYRTAGQPLADISELRLVSGFDAGVYARLRPWVCALPTTDADTLNVNTLSPDRALLVSALSRGAVKPDEARRMLAARPAEGWSSGARFLDQPFLKERRIDPGLGAQLQVGTRFFDVETIGEISGVDVVALAVLESKDGAVRTVYRRLGSSD